MVGVTRVPVLSSQAYGDGRAARAWGCVALVALASACGRSGESPAAPANAPATPASRTTAAAASGATPARSPAPPGAARPANAPGAVAQAAGPATTAPAAAPPATGAPVAVTGDPGASTLQVRRMAFARAIQERAPADDALPFTASDARIYAYFEVVNTSAEPDALVVTFVRPSGRVLGTPARLDVPAQRTRPWRTWAFARVQGAAGTWTVRVEDSRGVQLSQNTFEVAPAAAAANTANVASPAP